MFSSVRVQIIKNIFSFPFITAMGKTVDEILDQIGQMGRFQISRLSMFCFLMFPAIFQLLNMYYLAAEAPWQCVKNSTECKLNGSFVVGDYDYYFRCKINRSEWEYARYEGPHDSIVSEVSLDRIFLDFFSYVFLSVRDNFFQCCILANEKYSKPKIFLAFFSKLLCFRFIL